MRTLGQGLRRGPIAGIIALIVFAALTSCTVQEEVVEDELISAEERVLATPLYAPAEIDDDAVAGDLLRSEKIDSAPAGSTAWRVIYVTTDHDGTLIAASGTVLVPDAPVPDGGRVVVSWAHPTTGAAPRCAPSVGADPFILIEGARDLLGQGFAVVSADYPGLGIDGPDSYLIGSSTANSVLDIVLAAQKLEDTRLGSRVLLWGHSQGGQAVLFAAQSASVYAPELQVLAAAVAAPAADLATLFDDDVADISGITIGSYAFAAYESAYGEATGAKLTDILTSEAAAQVPTMSALCLLGQNRELHALAEPLVGDYLVANPTTTEPWASMLSENSAGQVGLDAPLFVAQGLADTLVRPVSTEELVARQCALGTNVTFEPMPDVGHGEIADRALGDLVPWFTNIVAGGTPATTC